MASAERPIDISDVVEFVASQLIRNYVSDKANQAMSTKRKSYFFYRSAAQLVYVCRERETALLMIWVAPIKI